MNSKDLIEIKLESLLGQNIAKTNLYIKLSDNKFVMVAKASTNLSDERVQALINKGVQVVYARADEYNAIVVTALSMAAETSRRTDVPPGPKIILLKSVTNLLFNEIYQNGLSREAYSYAKAISDSIIHCVIAPLSAPVLPGAVMNSITDNRVTLEDLVREMSKGDSGLPEHSLQVCFVSVMMGLAQGWSNPLVLEKLALGALLHDIGTYTFPKEMINTPVALFSPSMSQLYSRHPEMGRDMLAAHPQLPEEIAMIVHQHHENAIGTGFPQGLKDIAIHPLARVVAIATEFCHQVFGKTPNSKRSGAADALAYFQAGMGDCYNKGALASLQSVVQNSVRGAGKAKAS